MLLFLTCFLQPVVHAKVGMVSQEEFDSQRGVEEGSKEGGEEADGDLFHFDLQEGGAAKVEPSDAVKPAPTPAVAELKRRLGQ